MLVPDTTAAVAERAALLQNEKIKKIHIHCKLFTMFDHCKLKDMMDVSEHSEFLFYLKQR